MTECHLILAPCGVNEGRKTPVIDLHWRRQPPPASQLSQTRHIACVTTVTDVSYSLRHNCHRRVTLITPPVMEAEWEEIRPSGGIRRSLITQPHSVTTYSIQYSYCLAARFQSSWLVASYLLTCISISPHKLAVSSSTPYHPARLIGLATIAYDRLGLINPTYLVDFVDGGLVAL